MPRRRRCCSVSETQIPVMVEFELPDSWPRALAEAIPRQRRIVNELLAGGTIQSYSVSADRTRVWMVIVVEGHPSAVEEIVDDFPITRFGSYTWQPLLMTNDSSSVMHYSLN